MENCILSNLDVLKTSLKSYKEILSWFFFDSVLQNKWAALVVLVTGFLGVTFQIQVFGLVIFYTRHFSSGELITFAGYTFDPRTSLSLLAFGSLAVLLLLTLSSLCIYFSRRNILSMARKYEEFCSRRIFHLLGIRHDISTSIQEQTSTDIYLLRLVKADARLCGRVLRMLLSLIIPFITLLCFVSVLFYLEAGFTLAIIFLGIVLLFYQYKVNKKGLFHSLRFERLAKVAGKDYKAIIEHCKQQHNVNENRDMVEKIFAKGPVKNQLDAYEGRLRSTENSRFVSGIFMAVITSLVVLVMGSTIIIEGAGWGRLLAYIVALRFAMTNLQASFTILTNINRFYPQLNRNYLFVKGFAEKNQELNQPVQEYELQVKNKGAEKILESYYDLLTLRSGNFLSLITAQALNRYALANIIRDLFGCTGNAFKSAVFSMRFVTSSHSCPGVSLRQLLRLPAEAGWKDIHLPEKILVQLKSQLADNLDSTIKKNQWEKLRGDLKFNLSFAAVLASDCQWIILEEKGLNLIKQTYQSFFKSKLDNRIVVIVFNNNLSRVGIYEENFVAIMQADCLIGLGPSEWFPSVLNNVQDILHLSEKKKQSGSMPGGNDEDDFDES